MKTLYLNIRDILRTLVGFFEAIIILINEKPEVIFIKGGFVGVPVGFAAGLMRVPFITHDSDVLPGLANRLIARFASIHAVSHAVTIEKYYQDGRGLHTGPIISPVYSLITRDEQGRAKKQLGLDSKRPVVLVTGGGLGARRLNVVAAECLSRAVGRLQIIHIAGKGNVNETMRVYQKYNTTGLDTDLILQEYTHHMYLCSGAADVIITRAGGTMLAEFAAQRRACIVVPNSQLTGGHQVLNAKELDAQNAILMLDETPSKTLPDRLSSAVDMLITDYNYRELLAKNLHRTIEGQTGAAEKIAKILLKKDSENV